MMILDILTVTGWLLLGCILRFMLPYIILGLTRVGEKNTWKAWPDWEWRYVTSIVLSLLLYGITMLINPLAIVTLLQMTPGQIVLLAYSGQDILSRVVKPFRERINGLLAGAVAIVLYPLLR